MRLLGSSEFAVRATVPVKVRPGRLVTLTRALLTGLDRARIGLRNVNVDAQRASLRDAIEHGAAGGNQRTDIHIAQSDDAREGRLHDTVALHFIQARHVGFGSRDVGALRQDGLLQRVHAGDLRLILRLVLIVILLRNHARRDQTSPALRGDARQLQIGFALLLIREGLIQRRLRLGHIGFGLENLLIELGRFDFGQRLPGCNVIADVDQTAADVAVGARQNGGFSYSVNVARQPQFANFRGGADFDDLDARQCLIEFLRLRVDHGIALLQRDIACKKRYNNEYDSAQKKRPDSDGGRIPRLHRRVRAMGRGLLLAELTLQVFYFPAQFFFRAGSGYFFGMIWLGISHQMLKYGFVEFHSESMESCRSSSSSRRS